MIPGNGENRVRRRRFAEDVAEEDSSMGGSGLVSVSSLSSSSFKLAKGVRHDSSMLASSSRRSLVVDVELKLGMSICLVDVELVLMATSSDE